MVDTNKPQGKLTVGYARVSTPQQDYAAQVDEIRRFCEREGYALIDVLAEKYTGSSPHRPQWNRVMQAVEQRKVEAVVFTRIDRVARSTKHLLQIIEAFEKHRVAFIPIKDDMFQLREYPIPHDKRMLITIVAAVAEFEANLIKERMAEGRARAAVLGTKSGKPMHRPKADINWRRFNYLSSLGVPMRRIAKELGVSRTTLYKALKERRHEEVS